MCVISPFTYTQDGQTALYIASEKGNNECIELLLKANANPDIADCVSCDILNCLFTKKEKERYIEYTMS